MSAAALLVLGSAFTTSRPERLRTDPGLVPSVRVVPQPPRRRPGDRLGQAFDVSERP